MAFHFRPVPAWLVDTFEAHDVALHVVASLDALPTDAALVVLGAPTVEQVVAVRDHAPGAIVVGCVDLTAPEVAALIAVGIDDLVPIVSGPGEATARIGLIVQRVARRPQALIELCHATPAIAFRARIDTGDLDYVSASAYRLGLAEPNQVGPGGTWRDVLHPDEVAEIERRRQAAIAGTPQTFVHRMRTLDGRYLWMRADLRRVGPALIGSLLDVSAQHEVEVALMRIGHDWRGVLDTIPIGVVLFDSDRRIVRLNAAARAMFGGTFHELVGVSLEAFAAWQPWAAAGPLLDRALAGEPREAQTAPDADGRVWRLAADPLRTEHDPTPRAIVRVSEVTDELRQRRAAELNERMASMGNLVAGVAHEVRNPLFGISAIADALELRFAQAAEPLPHLTMLRTVVARLTKLMNELLLLGGTARIEPEPVALLDVLDDARQACAPIAREQEVSIEVARPAHPIVAVVDRAKLTQMFLNLFDNAIRHSPRGEVVRVTVAVIEGKRVRVVVRDRGPGFGEHRARALEPFYSRRKDGTGLGLAIVQQIAERHEAKVTLADAADGGAVVQVELPLERR